MVGEAWFESWREGAHGWLAGRTPERCTDTSTHPGFTVGLLLLLLQPLLCCFLYHSLLPLSIKASAAQSRCESSFEECRRAAAGRASEWEEEEEQDMKREMESKSKGREMRWGVDDDEWKQTRLNATTLSSLITFLSLCLSRSAHACHGVNEEQL